MASYTAEQLRGHTIRIEGEPGHIQGYELHIYDETDKQVIDNVKCVGLSLTPEAVNIAHVLLRHVDPITKQPVEEHVDVADAQLEVSFSAQVYDGAKPPRFVERDLDGQALANELRTPTALTIRSDHNYFEIGAGELVAGGVSDLLARALDTKISRPGETKYHKSVMEQWAQDPEKKG
jgi:hypothetical protein